MEELQTLIHRLREAGCRITQQRALILHALCELDGHASAEKVYERVARNSPDVDLSTVYRTLEMLRDRRILSQTDLGRGCAEFEIVTDQPHHHLICMECGRVIDLDHSYLEPVAKTIRRDFGFVPIFDHFAIFGRCGQTHEAEPCSKPGQESRELSEEIMTGSTE